MIPEDYGKKAYLKLQEIEKRLEKIEKEQKEFNYQELEFSLGSASNIKSFERSIKVNALREGKFTVSGKMLCDVVTITGVVVKFYVNDILCYSFILNIDVNFPFTFKTSFLKGVNTVKIKMTSLDKFNIDYLDLTVNGFLDYENTSNSLSIINSGNVDYILHQNQNEVMILTYTESENLKNRLNISNVLSANFVGFDSSYIYIALADTNNALWLQKINRETFSIQKISLNVGNVTCASGFMTDDGFKLLFCKLYDLYEGVYNKNTNKFTFYNTGKKCSKVFADVSSPNSYVMIDRFNNSKLVIE